MDLIDRDELELDTEWSEYIEEMADVLIAFSQLRYIYDITDDEIIKWLDAKQDRQRRLLSGGRC